MGSGWRRAKKALGLRVCTTVRRERDEEEQPTLVPTTPLSDAGEMDPDMSPNPKLCVNLGRRTSSATRSNPSTPRTQTHSSVSSPTLRCKTVIPGGAFSNPSSAANSPKSSSSTPASFFSPRLLCKTTKCPRMSHLSAPSSPRSPSRLSLLMSSLRFHRSNCGICTLSTKTGEGTAIFTAECSHAFHFPCISSYVQTQGSLVCPVCQLRWKEVPMLQSPVLQPLPSSRKTREEIRIYDDDEPLLHASAGGKFNTIPEVQEEEFDEEQGLQEVEFKGFPITGKIDNNDPPRSSTVRVGVVSETALVGAGRGYESYALVLRVCAPPPERDPARRPPIDLVTVLDVGGSMSGTKLTMMKRAMRLVISSLNSSDRLSIVAFSSASKRLLPLRRMTAQGQRAARRVVDRLVCSQGTCVPEALRKAAKVLEDRRDRNPFVSIILLSDGHNDSSADTTGFGGTGVCLPAKTTMTRLGHVEIPVHHFDIGGAGQDSEDKFAQCVGGLLSIVVHDLHVQIQPSGCEIDGVYSWHDRLRLLYRPSRRTGPALVRLGDFYAEEEREILVEVRVPAIAVPCGGRSFSVKCCFRDPVMQRPVYGREQRLVLPSLQPSRIASLKVENLKNRFLTTRAVAQAAHLVELGDLDSAHRVLSAARSSLSSSSVEHLRSLDSELAQLHWRSHHRQRQRRRVLQESEPVRSTALENNTDALTPTSAWRAAERLAKLAIMRKSLNRVSDLHGFENARF